MHWNSLVPGLLLAATVTTTLGSIAHADPYVVPSSRKALHQYSLPYLMCSRDAQRAVERMGFQVASGGEKESRPSGQRFPTLLRNWFGVSGCNGHIIADMSTTCAVVEVWATGDCSVSPTALEALRQGN